MHGDLGGDCVKFKFKAGERVATPQGAADIVETIKVWNEADEMLAAYRCKTPDGRHFESLESDVEPIEPSQ